NRRDDTYGGSLEGRSRLLCEAIRAIRARVGLRFPLIIKLNGSDDLPLRPGLKTSELVAVAMLLEREGVDAIEISVGHYESGFPMVRAQKDAMLAQLALRQAGSGNAVRVSSAR